MLTLMLTALAADTDANAAPESDTPAQKAEVDRPDWTITVDPLTFALGYAHVQVERTAGRYVSIYAGPHLRLFDGILTDGHEPYLGFGGEVGVRAFPWGKAPSGPWVMGRQVVARLHTTDDSAPAKAGGYSSVLLGYTGVIAGHFVLSGGAGLNYLYYDIGDYGTSGFFPALHTNLGVAF